MESFLSLLYYSELNMISLRVWFGLRCMHYTYGYGLSYDMILGEKKYRSRMISIENFVPDSN